MWWKIQFDDGLDGFGWLKLDETTSIIYTENGEEVSAPVSYHPIEFNTQPEWV